MLFENCRLKAKRVVNLIIDWADKDVYGFLEDAKCPMNPLYAEGQCRVGCIGCPMAGTKGREAASARWPKYKQLYLNAFERMLDARKQRNKKFMGRVDWATAEEVFRWWMEYDVLPVAVTPLRELPIMNPEKVCRICGKPIPPESGRRTLCSLECQAEFNRQSAKAAHAKAKALRAEQPKPPRYCALCGEAITRPNAKVCPACKGEFRRTYDREYKRTHQKKGNAK